MRESTRRRFAETATQLIARYEQNTEERLGFPSVFKAHEMQQYLFAELSRRCLQDCHQPGFSKTFCCARFLNTANEIAIEHNISKTSKPLSGPCPLIVFDETHYLYPAGNNGNQLIPFRQQGLPPPYFRRNCFVVRNLNQQESTVTVRGKGSKLVFFEGNQTPTEEESVHIALESGASAVIVCNKGSVQVPDFPIYFTSDVGKVVVYYVASLVA